LGSHTYGIPGSGPRIGDYQFEIIVAGYDADEKAKIEKLAITPVVIKAADGHDYWSHTTAPPEAPGSVHPVNREP
jgi:hypothetical protein